ncbi:hypothetical protein Anas_14689, partial [Armadillidium nasatum]
ELQNNARNSVEQESATFSPRSRTRSRSRVIETNQMDNGNTISDSVQNNDNSQPIYGRMRSRSRPSENDEPPSNNIVSEAQFVRERSRSRKNDEDNITGEKNVETPAPDDQVVSPPVQTVTIRLRKRPKKQESEESIKIPEGTADSNAPSQLEKQINSQEIVNTENKIDETPSVVIRRRVRPPKPEAVDDENKQEETATVTIRRRVREPKMEVSFPINS